MTDEIEEIRQILNKHENRIKALEAKYIRKMPQVAEAEEHSLEKLAEKVGTSTDKLQELLDIEDNALTLLRITGSDEGDRTKRISLVVLLSYRYVFGNDKVLSKEIRRNVAENRIPVNNFATYLNEMIPSLIRRIGKLKSPTTTYKLTPLGEAEAKTIVKELCQ